MSSAALIRQVNTQGALVMLVWCAVMLSVQQSGAALVSWALAAACTWWASEKVADELS